MSRRAAVIVPFLFAIASVSGCAPFRGTAPPRGGGPLALLKLDQRLTPSNDRDWRADMAVLSQAQIRGDEVTISNIRNSSYVTDEIFIVDRYDKTFRLSELQSVDFIVVPFKDAESLAHTMLSFGFGDGQYLVVSAEVRLENGEKYSPVLGALRQYELIYVVGDERDMIRLRTEYRGVDVYVYRIEVTREQTRRLFEDVLERLNQLHDHPEFYDSLTNNCTTNIVRHVNRLRPGRIPPSLGVLLPGYSDRLAFDLGLVKGASFEEVKRAAHINDRAARFADAPDFSERIRR